MARSKPNVLLVSSDQQRGDCIGPERRGVRTPNIDRIGHGGVRFTNCITPHPMCQAARASILTGKLPYSHGVRDNGRNLDPAFADEGLGGIFSRAGFATSFIGKAHFSSQQTFESTGFPECYSSAADYPPSWRGEYFGFDDVQLMLRPHHHAKWSDPPESLHYEDWLDADGQGGLRWSKAKDRLAPGTENFQTWRSALEDRWHSSPWIGDRAVEMIEGATPGRPWMSWVSFPDPHPPFLAPKPWCDMYGRDDVVIAANRTMDLDRRPWWHRAFIEAKGRTSKGAEHNHGGVDWGQRGDLSEVALRDITAIYFAMISAIDHQVGRLTDALRRTGQLDNTIVVFLSDHGEWLGDHGLLLKGPILYDGLLRVPFLVRGPGVPQNRVIDDPVSTLDVRATLADLCGIGAAPDNGGSLRGAMDGSESRDFALNEYEVDSTRSGVDLDLRTVRTGRHRMSVDLLSGAGELYDLQEDPGEMDDLFEDQARRAVRSELMDMIRSRPDDMIPAAPRVGWH
jgi:arylsulfatase A-like enzyme